MAKQDYIFRYLNIIKKLRRYNEATFIEIREYLKKETEPQDRPFSFSTRTFERDLNEIRSIFKIDIQYNFSSKVYYIADDQQSDMNNRMLESIDTINSLKMVTDVSKYMFFEQRKAKGTHHFYGLLHAIKNRIVINLIHQKYECDQPTERLVEPYALKESKGRWYVFAKDIYDNKLKTFGLDRVIDFENTPKRFDYPINLDVNDIFRYCFGVINLDDALPEEVILSFNPEQGKYIKSYPIHEPQTILQDNTDEFRIKLHLHLTHDLIMELLSYGDTVKIIAPKRLKDEITSIYINALES
jgi:predicted DNA-binding transcriptional regulator YafY